MTQNQISNAKLQEDIRHNKATEALNKKQNKINKQHYERSDLINQEHYARSDTASLISANAGALNAQASLANAETNRKNYELQYETEHVFEKLDPDDNLTSYVYDASTGQYYKWRIPQNITVSGAQKLVNLETDMLKQYITGKEASYSNQYYAGRAAGEEANSLNKLAGAGSSVLNAVFGKGGLVKSLD